MPLASGCASKPKGIGIWQAGSVPAPQPRLCGEPNTGEFPPHRKWGAIAGPGCSSLVTALRVVLELRGLYTRESSKSRRVTNQVRATRFLYMMPQMNADECR